MSDSSIALHWNAEYIPHTPHAKQAAFLMLPHMEAFYGGAASGGKSDALLMAALQYVDVPGYAGILFRKTLSELKLPQSLLSRAHSWLAGKNCLYVAGEHTYYFPTQEPDGTPGEPSKLAFGYIGNGTARERYQSAEFQFCLATNTKVVMKGGRTKPIQNVQVGDRIQTVNGNSVVTRVHGPRYKPCVLTSNGQIQGLDHRILTSYGWQSYASLQSNESCVFHKESWQTETTPRLPLQILENQSADQQRLFVAASTIADHQRMVIDVLLANGKNDSVVSDDVRREFLRLPKLFCLAKQPAPLSLVKQVGWNLYDKSCCDPDGLSVLNWQAGYRLRFRSYDGRIRVASNTARSFAPSLIDVETLDQRAYDNLGATGRTPKHSPACLLPYIHPYTKGVRFSWFGADQLLSMSPYGFAEVWDLTVADESNYVSLSNNLKLINANCAFDELTHHTESDYTWMFSRLRKVGCPKHPILDKDGAPIYHDDCLWCQQRKMLPIRMRTASNPGSVGHKWVQNRFKIAPSLINGVIRYIGHDPDRPFIPATVEDNQYVDQQSYIKSLDQLDPLTRAQLRSGDWGASLDARYKPQWFADRRYHRRSEYYVFGNNDKKGITLEGFQRVFTVVDPAASGREGPGDLDRYKKMDKSYTVIMTFGLTEDYNLVILDVLRLYIEVPDILKFVKKTYIRWKPQYIICEATGVGKAVYQLLNKAGLPVRPIHPHTDKIMRATDGLVRAEKGQIWLPQSPGPPWLKTLEDELFTWTGHPYETDDQIDCLSYGASDVSWEAAANEMQLDPELMDAMVSGNGPSILGTPIAYGEQTYSPYGDRDNGPNGLASDYYSYM